MTILHSIDEDKGIVLTTWIGDVKDSELIPAYKKLYEDGKWKPGFHEIVDMRNAGLNTISNEGLHELHMLVRSYTEGKCDGFKSILVASDEIAHEIAIKYQSFSEDVLEEVSVFEGLQEAYEFLRTL